MAAPTKPRWFQFDLRALFVLTAMVAAFLAWQFRPQPKIKSPIAESLKVGDRVIVRSNGGEYTIIVQTDSRPYRNGQEYVVESVDSEVVRLKGSNRNTVIRVARIGRVDRYVDPPKGSATAAANGGPGSEGMAAGSGGGLGEVLPGAAGGALGQLSPGGFGEEDPDPASGGTTNESGR